MKITPQRFVMESFREQAGWISALLGPLNQMFDDLRLALANQLSVEDNLWQEIKELKFKALVTSYPLRFRSKWPVAPRGLMAMYLVSNATGEPVALPGLKWSWSNGEIRIEEISGLTVGQSYTIRILAVYG